MKTQKVWLLSFSDSQLRCFCSIVLAMEFAVVDICYLPNTRRLPVRWPR